MTAINGLFVGISTIDMIYCVTRPPRPNEKITAQQQLICSGGPSTNAAIAFCALGGSAVLVSGLGSHPLTAIVRSELKRFGIQHSDLSPDYPGLPTVSSIQVTHSNGDRSVVSVNARQIGSDYLSTASIPVARSDIALFDGTFMDQAIEIAQKCKAAGIHTVLDAGSWKPGTELLIDHIDTAICSANFTPPGTASTDETLAWLHERGVLQAAITRGEHTILAAENGNRFAVRPPQLAAVRDTLAAGDIFHGAFVYFRSALPRAGFGDHLAKAAAVASESCAHFGPRKWIDTQQKPPHEKSPADQRSSKEGL